MPPSAPGLVRRLIGMAYESLLLSGVLILAFVLPHILIGSLTGFVASPGLLWGHLILVLLAYFTWFWTHGGQTLSMKTWRIRLSGANGTPVRPAQAIWRFTLCWPSLLLGGIGLWWALIDKDGQFLHDRLAGTRLRNAAPGTQAKP